MTATGGKIGGFTLDSYTLKGANVGMCSGNNAEWAFWAGASAGANAPFHVGHNGELYASKAYITGAIKSGSSINIGTSPDGNYSAFEVDKDGVIRIGNMKTNSFNGKQLRALRITQDGNMKIGGYSAYTHSDGYTKGIAEITSLGTVWSCSATDPYTYARLTEGKLEIGNTGVDPEYNGTYGNNVLDSKIVIQNGQIAIYNPTDTKYTNYSRALYLTNNTIGSAMGNVCFNNRIEVSGNIHSTKAIIISENAQAYRGVDTDGEQVSLAHVGADNVSRYGYGGWNSDSSLCYNAGSEFMGGNKATLKAKGSVYLGCNSSKYIRWLLNSDNNYVMRPNDTNKDIMLGTSSYAWKSVTAVSVNQTSDRTLKENINYISNANTIKVDSITLSDCYNFIKNDLPIATYNYIGDKSDKIGFIAQDLLYNADQTDNKVGQLIIDNLKYSEEDGKLTYNTNNLFGVMLGAMQVMADKIEELEGKLQEN